MNTDSFRSKIIPPAIMTTAAKHISVKSVMSHGRIVNNRTNVQTIPAIEEQAVLW